MRATPINNPSPLHELRVRELEVLAELIGCGTDLGQFADATHPDVLRMNLASRILFVGDAKATEIPSCTATRDRLSGYLRWVRAHDGVAVVAIMHETREGAGWREMMRDLFEDRASLVVSTHEIDERDSVTWVEVVGGLRLAS